MDGCSFDAAKALGVKAVGLPKKRGMSVEAMTGSEWIYKKLKRFRAGIEGNISMLKRVFGLDRCTWKGLEHFKCLCDVICAGLQSPEICATLDLKLKTEVLMQCL